MACIAVLNVKKIRGSSNGHGRQTSADSDQMPPAVIFLLGDDVAECWRLLTRAAERAAEPATAHKDERYLL